MRRAPTWQARNFYPRSPCGERRGRHLQQADRDTISIHALLAESDPAPEAQRPVRRYFYPRSPCGERLQQAQGVRLKFSISIHALLAESDYTHPIGILVRVVISIHALLAESDHLKTSDHPHNTDFYPRSPCGERQLLPKPTPRPQPNFYPRSPCGERRNLCICDNTYTLDFYPRSPCGERRSVHRTIDTASRFLSTLSLRRATLVGDKIAFEVRHFYPRSPCGERRDNGRILSAKYLISIHALLAESDIPLRSRLKRTIISIHALLAESDLYPMRAFEPIGISIHALLAESDLMRSMKISILRAFLSTLSLRRATAPAQRSNPKEFDFYPRSPCGERRLFRQNFPPILIFLSTLSLRRATRRLWLLAQTASFLSTLSLRRATGQQGPEKS